MSTPSEGSSRKDSAWQYAHLENPQNINRFKCNFCGKISNRGVYRVKQHLAGGFRNVTACPKCPAEVREEIREYMTKKKKEKEEMNMLPHFDELANAYEEDEEDDDVEVIERGKRPLAHGSEVSSARGSTTISTVSKTKKLKQKGPIDVFFTPNPDVVVQNQKAQGKQTRIDANDPYRKELRERACIRFARWMYDAGIPFNAVNCDSFGPMIEAIGQYGPDTWHMCGINSSQIIALRMADAQTFEKAQKIAPAMVLDHHESPTAEGPQLAFRSVQHSIASEATGKS